MVNILPQTQAPATPEHNKVSPEEGRFIGTCKDFLEQLATEGYILVKPTSDKFRISGNYEPIDLNADDETLPLILNYLGLDFVAWQNEKNEINKWLSSNCAPDDKD